MANDRSSSVKNIYRYMSKTGTTHIPFGPREDRVMRESSLQASIFFSTASSRPERCLWPSLSMAWTPWGWNANGMMTRGARSRERKMSSRSSSYACFLLPLRLSSPSFFLQREQGMASLKGRRWGRFTSASSLSCLMIARERLLLQENGELLEGKKRSSGLC